MLEEPVNEEAFKLSAKRTLQLEWSIQVLTVALSAEPSEALFKTHLVLNLV